ncbi:hypothetical protein NVP1213O_05 [Vibrio phage 1.213.O._10N.222.54.F10]|nr:hypothetical protein NVP1213O_05 [Vibrio phage 1.213.O._10N.222.54.F10]
MITCKEDLHYTYIANNKENKAALIARCSDFGIGICGVSNTDAMLEVYATCGDDDFEICSTNTPESRSKQLTLEDLKPQTKEVEWVNGDACIYDGSEYTFVGMTPTFNDSSCIVFDTKNGIEHVCVKKLSKPETEAERKEREELEAAYDLLCVGNRALSVTAPCTFDEFKLDEPQCYFWLSIVRKTNYKMNGE